MRLFEAILDANHRALSGDTRAGLRLEEYSNALPIIALTCIDPRLNPLMPEVLGIPEEHFIWLRQCRQHYHRADEQHHALARSGLRGQGRQGNRGHRPHRLPRLQNSGAAIDGPVHATWHPALEIAGQPAGVFSVFSPANARTSCARPSSSGKVR
jgi:hypothetical protein